MYKIILALFFSFSSITLFAQQDDLRNRPWDPAFRAAHANRTARLKSDSISFYTQQGSLSGVLKNRAGELIDFEELIADQKGKIVVVDLWTISCPPCIKSMPGMFQLIENMKAEEVSVIFLDVSQKENRWQQYCASGYLSEVKHNYWLSNSNNAKMIQTLALNSVPRYLIFDRQGRLCNAFAPKPEKGLQGYVEALLLDDQFEASLKEKAGN